MSGFFQFWSFLSCSWWNVERPSFMWSLWVICNKQRSFKPRHSLQGRPVIGCNPVLLSSPDGRKWQRRVSVDNGYTEMLYKSLSLSVSLTHTNIHPDALPSLEHDRLLWQVVHFMTPCPVFNLLVLSMLQINWSTDIFRLHIKELDISLCFEGKQRRTFLSHPSH